MTDTWNPAQYERFRRERSQPFYDLLALVQPQPGMRAADLGCGTGELTRDLHRTLGARETVGLDSSDAMLAKAGAQAEDGLRFERGDIQAFAAEQAGEPFDLIFSNAALQWVPDHERLLAGFTARLREGGQVAVQVPANDDHPSHAAAHEVAAEPPFREALGGYLRRSWILAPEAYASLLDRLGYGEQHVRLQVYPHHLPSRESVVEWVKGSLLTDYQRRLPANLFETFLERYRERLLPRLDAAAPYFYPFKRILFWARR